jgi:hypothetical protein
MDGFAGQTQPIFSLGQPIDLAARFIARELSAKCCPQVQLKLVDHAVPLPGVDIDLQARASWIP